MLAEARNATESALAAALEPGAQHDEEKRAIAASEMAATVALAESQATRGAAMKALGKERDAAVLAKDAALASRAATPG